MREGVQTNLLVRKNFFKYHTDLQRQQKTAIKEVIYRDNVFWEFKKQQRGKKELFSNTSCVLLYTHSCVITLTCDINSHNKCSCAVSQQTVLNAREHAKKPKEMGKVGTSVHKSI